MNAATSANQNPDNTLSRLKSGDDCAFNELVQSNWEKIYNRANTPFCAREKGSATKTTTVPYRLGYTISQPTLPETSTGIGGGGNARSRCRSNPQSPKTRT